MTETIYMAAVSGMLTLMGTMFTGYMAYKMAILSHQASLAAAQVKIAAVKVQEVKEVLEVQNATTTTKLDSIATVAEKTHTLVNSNMAVQLKLNAELSRWKADQTGLPGDIQAAELAEKMSREHEVKQVQVDEEKV